MTVRALLAMVLVCAATPASGQGATSCVGCHGDADLLGEEQARIVESSSVGAHAAAELSCHDCHGGNPDPALVDDMAGAMDPDFGPNPYRGVPERAGIPEFCGRCHSDPSYMRRFVPDPRVDQEREYWTSRHGELLETGDAKVATCVDCHGVHGILGPEATRSPVHPTNVAETCRTCHGDPDIMAGYRLPDGSPIPVDQYARWRQSVHAAGLLEREDLSAPTCNDCHGNHGAVPPGVESIAFVCGRCHGREAELFRNSAKREGFRDHGDFMAEAGDAGCAACHGNDQPATGMPLRSGFAECTTCHGNHGIVRATVALLGPLPDTPCEFCHDDVGGLASGGAAGERIREHFRRVRDRLLDEAYSRQLEGNERFDWLVEQAQRLPAHVQGGTEGEKTRLQPEFDRLFTKFRIGPTHYTYVDPVTGQEVRAEIRGCGDCHADDPDLADDPIGLATAREFKDQMTQLTTVTARADRLLLAAHRGGVRTRDAQDQIDQAVEAQIELAVLVHTFSDEDDGAFRTTAEQGLDQARRALELADDALAELAFRRRGLAASLTIILLVLVALALKIRAMR